MTQPKRSAVFTGRELVYDLTSFKGGCCQEMVRGGFKGIRPFPGFFCPHLFRFVFLCRTLMAKFEAYPYLFHHPLSYSLVSKARDGRSTFPAGLERGTMR